RSTRLTKTGADAATRMAIIAITPTNSMREKAAKLLVVPRNILRTLFPLHGRRRTDLQPTSPPQGSSALSVEWQEEIQRCPMSTDGHGEGAGRKTVHLTGGLPAVSLNPCPSVPIVFRILLWFWVFCCAPRCCRLTATIPPAWPLP